MTWLTRALNLDGRCPPGWKLTRAVSEGGAVDRALERHLDGCEQCASVLKSLCKLSATVQAFPRPPELGSEPRRVISRTAVDRLTPVRPTTPLASGFVSRRGRLVRLCWRCSRSGAPATQCTAGRSGGVSAPAPRFSSIDPSDWNGTLSRVQARPDEVVKLDEGVLVLEVAPLPPGERFRVRTRDAEVEVRGTRFQVSASDGELLAVSVTHGRVEVVSRGAGRAVLEPGDEWVHGARPRPHRRVPPSPAVERRRAETADAEGAERARIPSIAPGPCCARATRSAPPSCSRRSSSSPRETLSPKTLFTGERWPRLGPATLPRHAACSAISSRVFPVRRAAVRRPRPSGGCCSTVAI